MIIFVCPHSDISNCHFVTMLPLSFVASQPFIRWWITFVYCSSVQVARRSIKRDIVRWWEPRAIDIVHFRPPMSPPPVVGVPELPPPTRGMDVVRAKLDSFLVFCNSSCIVLFYAVWCESRWLVRGWVSWTGLIGRANFFAFLHH